MPTCPSCNRSNPAGVELCKNCGARLPVQEPESPPAQADTSPEPADEAPDELESQLLSLLRAGKKIQAVKLYREHHTTGLKEAKDAVEALAAQHGITAMAAGCASMLLLAALAGGTVAAFL